MAANENSELFHFLDFEFKMTHYTDKCYTDYHALFILHEAGAMDSGVSHVILNCSGGDG